MPSKRETGSIRYRINSDGFRDRRYARPKPTSVFRVLVLGDSITFGYGVEQAESYPKLLESELAEVARSVPVEVLNLGVGGYNPYNELERLNDYHEANSLLVVPDSREPA